VGVGWKESKEWKESWLLTPCEIVVIQLCVYLSLVSFSNSFPSSHLPHATHCHRVTEVSQPHRLTTSPHHIYYTYTYTYTTHISCHPSIQNPKPNSNEGTTNTSEISNRSLIPFSQDSGFTSFTDLLNSLTYVSFSFFHNINT